MPDWLKAILTAVVVIAVRAGSVYVPLGESMGGRMWQRSPSNTVESQWWPETRDLSA
jgi:hypothetical protein